jgi:adenine specific DNA methylase Mod
MFIKSLINKIFGLGNFRNEIVWCYTGPSHIKNNFPKKHDIIIRYTKSDKFIFNIDLIRIPYKGTLAPQGPKRQWNGNEKERIAEAIEKGKIVEDYWIDIAVAVRSQIERLGYPTQKPEKLLERVISASS